MVVCVNCGVEVKSLFHIYANNQSCLSKCINCGNISDKYVEWDLSIMIIDLLLFKIELYRHLVYNHSSKPFNELTKYKLPKIILKLSLLFISAIALDSCSIIVINQYSNNANHWCHQKSLNENKILLNTLINNFWNSIINHHNPLEVQSNSFSTRRGASSDYLSLKSKATPGDRGEGSDGSSIMGMMEDGAKDLLDVTSSGEPQVEPVADLREAEGEVNRRADGRTTSGGSSLQEDDKKWASSGEVYGKTSLGGSIKGRTVFGMLYYIEDMNDLLRLMSRSVLYYSLLQVMKRCRDDIDGDDGMILKYISMLILQSPVDITLNELDILLLSTLRLLVYLLYISILCYYINPIYYKPFDIIFALLLCIHGKALVLMMNVWFPKLSLLITIELYIYISNTIALLSTTKLNNTQATAIITSAVLVKFTTYLIWTKFFI